MSLPFDSELVTSLLVKKKSKDGSMHNDLARLCEPPFLGSSPSSPLDEAARASECDICDDSSTISSRPAHLTIAPSRKHKKKVFNFSAGPSCVDAGVLAKLSAELADYEGSGMVRRSLRKVLRTQQPTYVALTTNQPSTTYFIHNLITGSHRAQPQGRRRARADVHGRHVQPHA